MAMVLHEKPDIKAVSETDLRSYNFGNASDVFVLDKELSEISGLAYHKQTNTLYAINDERGYFFRLDPKSGEILDKSKFHKKGDYEAIEIIDQQVIVAKHNGTLYLYDQITKETKSINTGLTAKNDLEGLCIDEQSNKLLIACKGQDKSQKGKKNSKSVYAFDLNSMTLLPEPIITIEKKELLDLVTKRSSGQSKSSLKRLKNKIDDFSPSGIAIHPETKEVYIISARGSSIVLLSKDYNVKEIFFLNTKIIPQPEGICFDTESNLFISTEGQGFSAKIFKYIFK